MKQNPQGTADLVTFTKEIYYGKQNFLYSAENTVGHGAVQLI